jgi:hypothetical protein
MKRWRSASSCVGIGNWADRGNSFGAVGGMTIKIFSEVAIEVDALS